MANDMLLSFTCPIYDERVEEATFVTIRFIQDIGVQVQCPACTGFHIFTLDVKDIYERGNDGHSNRDRAVPVQEADHSTSKEADPKG